MFLFYILPCNTWRRCLCYSGRTLQQGRELLLVLLAHTSNSHSCSTGSLATRVPYLEVVIQDPGILYCSVLFVTKHCHVQEGLAAHAVNRKKPESVPVPTAAGSPAIHHVGWGQAPIGLSANSRDLRISPVLLISEMHSVEKKNHTTAKKKKKEEGPHFKGAQPLMDAKE